MATRARLLVALALRGRVATEVDGLRRAFGASQLERIPPHITLVPPTNLASATAAIAPERVARIAARHAPFRLSLGPAATFPDHRSVLFLAVSASPELAHLREELLASAFGEPVSDPRAFVPHVTVDSRRGDFVDAALLGALSSYRADVLIESVELLTQQEDVATRPWSITASVDLGTSTLVGRGGLEVRLSSGVVAPPWPIALVEGWDDGEAPSGLGVDERYCLAELDGRTVGLLTWLGTGDVATLSRHIVQVANRGLGVGSKLLAFAESAERTRGTSALRVIVPGGSEAERYYLGRGYQRRSVVGELVREL